MKRPTNVKTRRYQLMGLKEMLDLARRYWEVAARMTDEQAKQGLLDLAQRYEALANQLRAATCTD